MGTLTQTLIVAAIVGAALWYLVRAAWRQFRKPACGGGPGCRCGE